MRVLDHITTFDDHACVGRGGKEHSFWDKILQD